MKKLTWAEVCESVRGLDPVVVGDRNLRCGSGVTELAIVQRGEWVELLAAICYEDRIEPRTALRVAGMLLNGCITVIDGRYVLRLAIFMARVDVADFGSSLSYVRATTATIREQLRAADPRSSDACFSHYAS